MLFRVGDIVLVDEKNKYDIKISGKDGCVTVFYLVST